VTDKERLEKFKVLQELVNGAEADKFLNYWDGRFFTGNMTFVFEKAPYNMVFYRGKMIDVYLGLPENGFEVGISGSIEQWEDFFKHRNFQLATSIKHNPLCFENLGSALANRQNNAVIAQVMRLAAKAICD